jgi:ubiquinone/menaquinone biosynthesis C-methylase UbiE
MSARQTPPSWAHVGRHSLFPEASHDDVARFDFLANLNGYLSSAMLPRVRQAWENRVRPAFEREHGRAPEDRHEVRKAMAGDPVYQTWSALRRNSMEMRQQVGRALVLGQLPALIEKARAANDGAPTLKLDPAITPPRYADAVDIHCMPGGYHGALSTDDVSNGANYDSGIFATTGGMLGRWNDGGGQALVEWLKESRPGYQPQRILDIGCTIGHNIVPAALAFPDAEIIAVDTAAPMLRYGHARAQALGARNITFMQANAEALPWPDGYFDLITTAMFWHETSNRAMPKILAEIHRLLAPGGLTVHLEQPQYAGMDPYEQFIRDWDALNNNEPFWSEMHDYDLKAKMTEAGFTAGSYFETKLKGVVDREIFPEAGGASEDYGRAPVWTAFGATK